MDQRLAVTDHDLAGHRDNPAHEAAVPGANLRNVARPSQLTSPIPATSTTLAV